MAMVSAYFALELLDIVSLQKENGQFK